MNLVKLSPCSSQFSALCACIGLRAARKLCRSFGGSSIYIPKLDIIDRPRRNRQIALDAASGASISRLCTDYHLSERQIRRILHQTCPQPDFWSQPW